MGPDASLIGVQGLEPRLTEPESAVLPIRRYPSDAGLVLPRLQRRCLLLWGGGKDDDEDLTFRGFVHVDAVPTTSLLRVEDVVGVLHLRRRVHALEHDALGVLVRLSELAHRVFPILLAAEASLVELRDLVGNDRAVHLLRECRCRDREEREAEEDRAHGLPTVRAGQSECQRPTILVESAQTSMVHATRACSMKQYQNERARSANSPSAIPPITEPSASGNGLPRCISTNGMLPIRSAFTPNFS